MSNPTNNPSGLNTEEKPLSEETPTNEVNPESSVTEGETTENSSEDEFYKEVKTEVEAYLNAWRQKVTHVICGGLTLVVGLVVVLATIVFGGIAFFFTLGLATPVLLGVWAAAVVFISSLPLIMGKVAGTIAKRVVPTLEDSDQDEEWKKKNIDPKNLSKAQKEAFQQKLMQEMASNIQASIVDNKALFLYSKQAVILTKCNPVRAAFVHTGSLVGVSAGYTTGGLLLPLGLAMYQLAKALQIQIPLILKPPKELKIEESGDDNEEKVEKEKTYTALDVLSDLRRSSVYRGQDVGVQILEAYPFAYDDGISLLQDRYPRLTDEILEAIKIDRLSSSQTQALRSIFSEQKLGESRDHVLVGWSGSGRSTLVNLLTLGSLMHREGAVHCVSPEDPSLNTNSGPDEGPVTRTPSTQIKQWLKDTLQDKSIQEAYVTEPSSHLHLSHAPDVVFTDVYKLIEEILSKVQTESAQSLLRRLRYVVIDHPHRLSREELIRLRIAISRLRLTTEMMGKSVKFIIILPRLNNFAELSKWLLNNDNVDFIQFSNWYDRAEIVGWLPPPEPVYENLSAPPKFVRADFTKELLEVLIEIGLIIHYNLEKARLEGKEESILRVAVVDTLPVLGPEMRSHLSDRVLHAIKEMRPNVVNDEFSFLFDWQYFGTSDLNIMKENRYDIIISIGIGAHPEHLVSSLRGALNTDGLIILMGDSSPVDYESLREISHPNWSNWTILEEANYPKLLIPNHSEAIIAHQLVSMFEDFNQPVPLHRLYGVFPSEHTADLLHEWMEIGYLEKVQVFESRQSDTSPERIDFVRQPLHNSFLRAEQYEIPWGCCSRTVLSVYDSAAKSLSRTSDFRQSTYIDHDRVFIDYFIHSKLRFSPNTVEVTNIELSKGREADKGNTRWSMVGRINVRQVDFDEAILIDRRKPRFHQKLVAERPFSLGTDSILEEYHNQLNNHPLYDKLSIDPKLTHIEFSQQKRILLANLKKVGMQYGNRKRDIRIYGGIWIGRIFEQIGDVLVTDQRLVEEPDCISVKEIPISTKQYLSRNYECVMASLFFERLQGTTEFHYSAFNAIANLISLRLEKSFLNFRDEYRVCVLPVEKQSSSKNSIPAHLIPPKKGGVGKYSQFEPENVEGLLHEILPNWKSMKGDFPIDEICSIFEWMHQNITYTKDEVLYNKKEHIATMDEVLSHRSGDCEDHALLIGSLLLAMGLNVRMVLLKDHALCQVYLGPSDRYNQRLRNRINNGITGFYSDLSKKHSLDLGCFPYSQGVLAKGWKKNEKGGYSRDSDTQTSFFTCVPLDPKTHKPQFVESLSAWVEEYDGEVWMTLDDCIVGRYPGDVSGLIKGKYLEEGQNTWKDGDKVEYQYPTQVSKYYEAQSTILPYRIAIYRLRRNELYMDEHMLYLLDREMGYEIFPWIYKRLEGCACHDGCSSCCGVMGSITKQELETGEFDIDMFSDTDLISRRSAYELVCNILGKEPRWEIFERGHTAIDHLDPIDIEESWEEIVDYIGIDEAAAEQERKRREAEAAEKENPSIEELVLPPDVTPQGEGEASSSEGEDPGTEEPAEDSATPPQEQPREDGELVSGEEKEPAEEVVTPTETSEGEEKEQAEEEIIEPTPEVIVPPVQEPPSEEKKKDPPLKTNLIQRLDWEIHQNGLWDLLFNQKMEISAEKKSNVEWMRRSDPSWNSCLGYYSTGKNVIVLRPSKDRDQLIGTLIHEYTHNWQFTSGNFDVQKWIHSPEAMQYFSNQGFSLLVVEGHARFADQMYSFHKGIQSRYHQLHSVNWDEYKVGYFLILGIYQAFGEHGLYRWLKGDVGEPILRSRNPRLKWGFTLTQALDVLGLLFEARTQQFDGIDLDFVEEAEKLVAKK